MMKRIPGIFAFACIALCGVSVAHASDLVDAQAPIVISNALVKAQQQESELKRQLVNETVKSIAAVGDRIVEGFAKARALEVELQSAPMPDIERLNAILSDRVASEALSDSTRHALNDTVYQLLFGYKNVDNAAAYGDAPSYAAGPLPLTAKLATMHRNMFCNPVGRIRPPDGCGRIRQQAGIQENDNMIDFLLSERTWPRKYVLDAMTLMRSFFFSVSDPLSLADLKANPSGFLGWQRKVSADSIRMSVLNELAARRAPTSTAAPEVMEMLLNNFAVSGKVSSTNIDDLCNKDPKDTPLPERYACSLTNKPDGDMDYRIISQASIDRIIQHDYYTSAVFYNKINAPINTADGALDRMEVFMLAQQVAQDYRFLRLLQMETAVASLNASKGMRR